MTEMHFCHSGISGSLGPPEAPAGPPMIPKFRNDRNAFLSFRNFKKEKLMKQMFFETRAPNMTEMHVCHLEGSIRKQHSRVAKEDSGGRATPIMHMRDGSCSLGKVTAHQDGDMEKLLHIRRFSW